MNAGTVTTMRLCDIDALIAEYDKIHVGAAGKARQLMVDAPAVDAVPVIRCGECKHNLRPDKPNSICEFEIPIFDIYGFCSEGERREDGDEE